VAEIDKVSKKEGMVITVHNKNSVEEHTLHLLGASNCTYFISDCG
jgi:hypothetical protein